MSVKIFVINLPEFKSLINGAKAETGCNISLLENGYWLIQAESEITFKRKELGLGPALWNSALSGGYCGLIQEFSRDVMTLVSSNKDLDK